MFGPVQVFCTNVEIVVHFHTVCNFAKMADSDKQIRQMADFIKLEAKEKAAEIRAKASFDRSRHRSRRCRASRHHSEPPARFTCVNGSHVVLHVPRCFVWWLQAAADANLEKQNAVRDAKMKLADDYDRKEKALAVEQRMLVAIFSMDCSYHTYISDDMSRLAGRLRFNSFAYLESCSKASMDEQKQRSRLLAARDEFIQKLSHEAKQRLGTVASSNAQAYNNLLKDLIKQSLFRLEGETSAEVHCRPQDLAAAQKAAVAAAAALKEEAKRTVTITAVADPALGGSSGGVIVWAQGGRIKCNNTLEDRLSLLMNDLTPVVRDLLFPSARAEVRTHQLLSSLPSPP